MIDVILFLLWLIVGVVNIKAREIHKGDYVLCWVCLMMIVRRLIDSGV